MVDRVGEADVDVVGCIRVVDLAGFAVHFADCDCFGHCCELRSDVGELAARVWRLIQVG